MASRQAFRAQSGATMIEVLVTMVVVAFGLLGMAGLHSRLQLAEMEAYQRAQALVLLNDMSSRIQVNRASAVSGSTATNYVTSTPIGADSTCLTDFAGTVTATVDKREWCQALQGAAEVSGTTKQGAMIGARGCITDLGSNQYMVTIAWQGIVPMASPVSSVTCGANLYDGGTSTGCISDRCRRVVTTVVRIAPLT